MRFSDTEWLVMRELWRSSPATVRLLLDLLEEETGWAYSTLKTILHRLAEKGAVSAQKRGNVIWYSPLVEEEDARTTALRSLVERAFGGRVGGLVQHLVSEERLSARERSALRELLDREDPGGEGR